MTRFALAIAVAVVALWCWWLEKRRAALAQSQLRAAQAADPDDDDDDDDTGLERRRRRLQLARMPLRAVAWTFTIVAALLFVSSFFRVVPPGNAGVPVTFGSTGSQVGSGLHLAWPVTGMTNISVRTQNYTMAPGGDDPAIAVLGSDGTAANATASLLYRVDRSKASDVYENVGTGYSATVVQPTARSCTRASFAAFDMVDAATVAFDDVENAIAGCIEEKLGLSGITVRDFQLREINLSAPLQASLDNKAAAAQVGASGPLDPAYLRLLYIQTLQAFAKNGGTIVVPGDSDIGVTVPSPTPTTTAP
jgi:SPFH domain / Band 7 family